MTIETVPGSPLPPIEIVGDHCHLRPFRSDDLHLVEEASRDGFIPLITTVPSEWSPDRGRAFIDRQNCRHSSGEGWSLAIVDRGPDLAIGQIGLWTSDLHKGRAEIGYWVVASGRGRGAASHALETLSEWAFEHLDIDRLSVFVEPWNTASIKAAERSGFRREGMLRNWERVGGVPRDMWSFVRTRPDHANSDADGEARVRTG